MPGPKTLLLAGLLLLTGAAVRGQDERPSLFVPAQPPTKKEQARREALYRYAYGLICEREDRLMEALQAFQQAAELDPKAAEPVRAQVPLLLLLDRPRDALACIKTVLKLYPEDHPSWFLAGRLHKGLGEVEEYRAALEKGLAVPGMIEEHPAIAQQLFLDLGQHLEATEKPADAIRAYTEAAKILDHPDVLMDHGPFVRESIVAKAAETYEKIGNLEQRLKHFDAALKAYRTALERQPDTGGRMNLHMARLSASAGRPAEALGYVDAYLRLQPQGAEPYQLKIELLGKLGRSAEVVPWLEQASRADALNVNLRLLLAQQYAAGRRLDQAERVYQALAVESPSEDVYRGYFGLYRQAPKVLGERILAELDRAVVLGSKKAAESGTLRAADQARAMLAVLREDGDLSRALLEAAFRPGQGTAEVHSETGYFLAVLADKHAQLDRAETFYRRALALPNQVNEAPLYAGLLKILAKEKKYEETIAVCKDGLKRSQFTHHLLFYNYLAQSQARLGRLRDAEASADRAWQIAGDNQRIAAASLKVHILLQAQKYKDAEALGQKLFGEVSAPGDVQEARYLLSNVYSAWKKMDRCEELLEEILRTDPANATVNNDLGYIWADQSKHLPEAEAMIRKALDLDRRQRRPGDEEKDKAAYVDSLGWVLFRRGDLEAARKELERAVSLPDGDDPTLWDHLGDVYFRLERYLQAQNAWERSLDLYEKEHARPKDERYRDVQRKLRMAKELVRAQ